MHTLHRIITLGRIHNILGNKNKESGIRHIPFPNGTGGSNNGCSKEWMVFCSSCQRGKKSVGLLGCTNTYSNRRVLCFLACNEGAISFVSSWTGGILMKLNRDVKYGIGALIVDGLLILETANDMRTGKLTWPQFAIIIMVCMIITFILAAIFRRRRRK